MSESYSEQFSNHLKTFIADALLQPICDWIEQNPNEKVTPEKLLEFLDISIARTPRTTPAAIAPSVKRSKRVTSTNRPQCEWTFKRGDRKGFQCTEPSIEGSQFCRSCSTKKTAGGQGRAKPAASSEEGPKRRSRAKPKEPEEEETKEYLNVEEFGTAKDGSPLYKDHDTQFVIKLDEEEAVVVGYATGDNAMRPLTDKEIKALEKERKYTYESGVELQNEDN